MSDPQLDPDVVHVIRALSRVFGDTQRAEQLLRIIASSSLPGERLEAAFQLHECGRRRTT